MHYTHFLFSDLNYIRSGSGRLSFIKGVEEAEILFTMPYFAQYKDFCFKK